MLNLHNLSSQAKKKTAKRLGRGSASRGDYSGRGLKGQKARSGVSGLKLKGMKSWLFKTPKKRGFVSPYPAKQNLNLADLDKYFAAGAEVTPFILKRKGLIKDYKKGVKVLGGGQLTKKLNVKVQAVSQSARVAIESAGGTVELMKKFVPQKKSAGTDKLEKKQD